MVRGGRLKRIQVLKLPKCFIRPLYLQNKTVHVHRLTIKDTIEERIMKLQEQKKQIANRVLGEGGELGGQAGAARLDIQDLMMLFRDH